jgi:hypothetical protein
MGQRQRYAISIIWLFKTHKGQAPLRTQRDYEQRIGASMRENNQAIGEKNRENALGTRLAPLPGRSRADG